MNPDVPPPSSAAPPAVSAAAASPSGKSLWQYGLAAVLGVGVVAALALAWASQHRVKLLEQQLVARQQQSQTESAEALVLARQSQDTARESAARMTLLEAKLAEVSVQRSQLDELIQSLTRSRDENLLADIESALRTAQQQAALTGSLEPLVAALRQADERLARHNQPSLERVRRAVLRDLERVRGASQVDVATLVIRIDEVARQVDDLPLLAVARGAASHAQNGGPSAKPQAASTSPAGAAEPTAGEQTGPAAAASSRPAPSTPSVQAPAARPWEDAAERALQWGRQAASVAWNEARSLVRISRIDHPEAALTAPEQQFFLRENLKLRLLNARLALLSRQFDIAQSDLRDAQRSLERHFDPSSRRVGAAADLLRQVSQMARQVNLPRPDETLAALAAVSPLR